MGRLEQRACGDLAMYLRAAGRAGAALHWANQCSARDFRLPPRQGRGQDGSHNFAPCLLAGAGRWEELGAALDEYWARGAGNEFNSPLYGGRVYVAAALRALLTGDSWAYDYLERWTGFLALQAVVVRNQPRQEPLTWAGEPKTLRHQIRNGVAIPPTGMRANTNLGNPYFAPILAEVLGITVDYHHVPKHWSEWKASRNKEEWARPRHGNAPSPWVLVRTLALAEEASGRPLVARPHMQRCRRVVQGDMARWRELAAELQGQVPLPRAVKRFVIERTAKAVMTWWTGTSPTRQKPSVPAAAVLAKGRPRTRILVVAKWHRPPNTQTRSRLVQSRVIAEADTVGELHRLSAPTAVVEFG